IEALPAVRRPGTTCCYEATAYHKPDKPVCRSFSPLSPLGATRILVDLVFDGLHKIARARGTSKGADNEHLGINPLASIDGCSFEAAENCVLQQPASIVRGTNLSFTGRLQSEYMRVNRKSGTAGATGSPQIRSCARALVVFAACWRGTRVPLVGSL